jgi:hemolysin D
MLDTLQAYTDLEKSREVYERELTQKRVSAEALDAGRRSLIATTRAQLADRLAEIAARLETLTEDLRTADRRVAATVITAPVAGTIDQLKVFTIGGIVEAGAELMRVVPSGTTYEVEAVFANQDVGFIRQGQPVNIRLDAFPSERFGFLRGTVADVAADSTQSDDGSFGYVVRITPKTKQLVVGAQSYPLRPGMTGRADVTTDERRIISYFFAPIVQVVQAALGER